MIIKSFGCSEPYVIFLTDEGGFNNVGKNTITYNKDWKTTWYFKKVSSGHLYAPWIMTNWMD